MSLSLPLALWLVACGGDSNDTPTDDAADTDTDTDVDTDTDADADTDSDSDVDTDTDADTDLTGTTGTTGDTGEPPEPPEVLAATCTPASHPLLVNCELTLDAPGPAQVDVTLPDGTVRPYVSTDLTTTTPSILVWGLPAETSFDWSAGPHTGTFMTGILPLALQNITLTTTGDTDAFDAILRPFTCNGSRYLVMAGTEGEIVWFVESDVWNSGMHPYEWNPEDRTVMVGNFDQLQEIALDGTVLMEWVRGVHYEEPLHHDVARWGPYTYLLYEYREGTVWVDGIYVFDGLTQIGDFKLGDHYTISGGFGDWSHGNGLENGDDGELTLSLLVFDTVLGVDGDPDSPTFLEVTWGAGGTSRALPGVDYMPPAGPDEGFDGQHNATRRGDELWLFDNLSAGRSRAARYDLDDSTGEVRHAESWLFDATCPIQGGAVPVGDGVLGTCVAANDVRYFESGTPTAVWDMSLQCGQVPGIGMNRAIPVTVW